jgi:hypothetical protein
MSIKHACSQCGKTLSEGIRICPDCRCENQTVTVEIEDSMSVHDNLKGKVGPKRKMSPTSKRKKYPYEFYVGEERCMDRKKWVNKEQILDRENDKYKEKVVDLDTNEVIHECEEPLSDHINHGSAKKSSE